MDERGSPVAIVDDAGTLMKRVDYDSYSVARNRWSSDIDGESDILDENMSDALRLGVGERRGFVRSRPLDARARVGFGGIDL